MTELEHLQAIVADDSRSAEERKAAAEHILALGQPPTQLTPSQAVTTSTVQMSESDTTKLVEMKKMLKEIQEDDPAPYLAAHKKCSVCLRHNLKDAPACALCGSEGQWEAVVDAHPTWKRIGRGQDSTKEHLSNITTYGKEFEAAHLRYLMNWREGDGTRQINAAKFESTQYVLSYEQRCWCKQILKWLEPGGTVLDPEPDPPEPEVEVAAITVPAREIPPGELNKLFAYQSWRIEREASGQPSEMSDWIVSTGFLANSTASATGSRRHADKLS